MLKRIGWIANGLLITGSFLVGGKSPAAFVLIAAGESLWAFKTYRMKQWDMFSLCVVFGLLAIRNFYLWTMGP